MIKDLLSELYESGVRPAAVETPVGFEDRVRIWQQRGQLGGGLGDGFHRSGV